MIRLVVLDLDGTIYDYDYCNEIAEKHLYSHMIEVFGISEVAAKNIYKEAKAVTKNQLGNVAAAHNRLLYMQNMCEIIGVSPVEYAVELYHVYWDTFLDNMRINDNIVYLLEDLKKEGIKIAILSDLTAYIQYRKIKKLNIGNYIDYIVTSEEVGEEKPSSKMYEKALSKCGCSASEAIMIGDDYVRDVEGARKYGCNAVLYHKDNDLVNEIRSLF